MNEISIIKARSTTEARSVGSGPQLLWARWCLHFYFRFLASTWEAFWIQATNMVHKWTRFILKERKANTSGHCSGTKWGRKRKLYEWKLHSLVRETQKDRMREGGRSTETEGEREILPVASFSRDWKGSNYVSLPTCARSTVTHQTCEHGRQDYTGYGKCGF